MNVVRVEGLTKSYRDTTALDAVSFALAENTIHGLLGRNGAGKSTVMQILTGQNHATSGTVEVFGENPYENAAVLARTCFVKESQRYPDTFKVRHALAAAAGLYPHWDAGLAAQLVDDFGLPRNRTIRKLSRGMLSAVGIVIGLASRAPLTFFDEPYLGLDAVARQLFYDRLLADYAEHPRTVVLSTHLIDEVSDLIEHVVVLDRGHVLIDADADELRQAAVTVSGPAEIVDAFAHGRDVLHRERLGAFARATVAGPPDLTVYDTLDVEPVSLQQLVVRATQRAQPVAAGTVTEDHR